MKFGGTSLGALFTVFTLALTAYAADPIGNASPGLGLRRSAPPLIVPGYLRTQEFFTGSATFTETLRSQQVYTGSEFGTTPILITAIYWRPSPNLGAAFSTVVPSLQVNLSTTSKQGDELSSTFAENIGRDEKVVFNGPLKFSSEFQDAAGGTKKFDMKLRLKHPFYYDPAEGNLLLDIRNFQGSAAVITDAYGTTEDGCSRAVSLDANATTASFMDTAIDPVQIIFTPAARRKHPLFPIPRRIDFVKNSAGPSPGSIILVAAPGK
jgi:hypothetical protein